MLSENKKDLGSLLENISIDFSRRFISKDENAQSISLAHRVITEYSAIYDSLKIKLRDSNKKTTNGEDSFLRSYMTYIAAEGVLQLFEDEKGSILTQKINTARTPSSIKIKASLIFLKVKSRLSLPKLCLRGCLKYAPTTSTAVAHA